MAIVNLILHVEWVESDKAFCWWAESEDVPGLSVASDNIPELRGLAQEAVRDIVGDDAELRYTFASDEPPSVGPAEPDAYGTPQPSRGIETEHSPTRVSAAA
ncbi:MAG: hypothetical protein ABSB68_02920 [Acidimicrobiales bacterium]